MAAVRLVVVALALEVVLTVSLNLEVVGVQLEVLVLILELGVVDLMASVAELGDLAGHLETAVMDLVVVAVVTWESEVAAF